MWNNKTLILKDSDYMNPQVTEWVKVLLVSVFLYSGTSVAIWFLGLDTQLQAQNWSSQGLVAALDVIIGTKY